MLIIFARWAIVLFTNGNILTLTEEVASSYSIWMAIMLFLSSVTENYLKSEVYKKFNA